MRTALADALRRLDVLLARVCDAEEVRAKKMYVVERGWDSLRATLEPPAAELAYDVRVPEAPLCPPGQSGLPALEHYREALDLSALEADALFVLLAPYLEPRYAKLFLVLQDDLPGALIAERALFTILGRSPARAAGLAAALSEDGALVAGGLVAQPTGTYAPRARPIDLAPDVRDALLAVPAPRSASGVELAWRTGAATGEPRPGIRAVVGGDTRDDVIARLEHGPLIRVQPGTTPERDALRTWWRIAVAHDATLVVDAGGLDRIAGLAMARALLELVEQCGGRAIVSSPHPLALAVPQHDAPDPSFGERRALWRDAARARGAALDDAALDRLANNHRLDRGKIERIVAAGDPSEQALSAAAHRLTAGGIRHAVRVPVGRTFADLVLRDSSREALERLIYFVENRDRIADAQGLDSRFRLRRGPVVLFSGRSGTGKTLAAEVVAGAVGRPLFTVDLSQLVSKYIGETEKHIDEVLRGGERAGAVLFFDEADAMFSSRTDVSSSNDRYANLEVGYLLQRIEQHDGLVILATNLNQSIDEAFLRRFHSRIEFPFPEPAERRRIWELMLPAGAAVDLERVERLRLAGGDIRNAALKAIFLAARDGVPVDHGHVERAVSLELYELGRLSRRTPQSDDIGAALRALTEQFETALETELRQRFWKEVHLIHGAPTKETLAGKRPAASLAIYRLASTGDGGLRIGMIVSAWSQHASEEHELLGVLLELLMRTKLAPIGAKRVVLAVQKSFDFDLLHRFWSSHGHPMRPSLVVDVEIG